MMDVMSMEEMCAIGVDELNDVAEYEAFDDVTGETLEPNLVMNARKEELKYFDEMAVYEYAAVEDCWSATGSGPIGTRWIDINKGDTSRPNYRSRLVAKYLLKSTSDLRYSQKLHQRSV